MWSVGPHTPRPAPRQEREHASGVSAGHQETELLCLPGIIIRSFFIVTKQLPKLSWASDGPPPDQRSFPG